MIVYDRGAGEIRYRNKILKAENVTLLTVREVGTGSQSMSNRIVFAELRNGPAEALGPTGPIMSAQRWAKAAVLGRYLKHVANREEGRKFLV